MSKNEQSHKEKPVSELLQEQSKELKSSCENIPAGRRFGRRSGRQSDGQHPSESESSKVDGNDLKQ